MNFNEEKIVEFFNMPDWPVKQKAMAKRVRMVHGRFLLIVSIIVILIGVAFFLLGLTWESKKSSFSLFMGPLISLVGFYQFFKYFIRILKISRLDYENDLEQLCKKFYSVFIINEENPDVQIIQDSMIECTTESVPAPICEKYAIISDDYLSWSSLAKRWLAFRRWDKDSVVKIKIDQLPRSGQDIVDVTIHFTWGYGKNQKDIFTRNVAFRVKDKCFLATPEPVYN